MGISIFYSVLKVNDLLKNSAKYVYLFSFL